MSNLGRQCEQTCGVLEGEGMVQLIVEPVVKELGGFSVRRLLPTVQRRMVGPWIFFDHMGPADFPPGKGIDVRPHPHIGIATVTYLFEGEILHRDSLGNCQAIRPGDINLMVSGRGIVHSERERPSIRERAHSLHGLQLWLALPEEREEIEPSFHHYPDADIPSVSPDGVAVRVMMGSAYGVTSPVRTFSDTLYLEAHLEAKQQLVLAPAAERAIYVAQGTLRIGETVVPEHGMAFVTDEPDIVIEATSETRMVLVGGESFSRRYIEWNFVSSRQQRIEEAKDDWRAQRFPTVPGDEKEFIPLPE